jgi:FAD/FMN-containing dehydrogenase
MLRVEALRELLGPGGFLGPEETALRPANFKTPTPRTAIGLVRPRSTAEVSAILRLCHEAGQPVCIQGGLSVLDGSISAPNELALSLERLNTIEEIDPVNRTAVVQAGCVLQSVQEAVQAQGLEYGVDYGGRSVATIGGNISTNAGGNRVLRYGMTRDQVLGLEAVLADGTVISAMNQMLKNNAGYDLKHLFIGTEGTLGVVTRAVLRLRPLPASTQTALVSLASFGKVQELLASCERSFAGTLTSFEVMWREHYEHVVAYAGRPAPLPIGQAFYVLVETRGSNERADAAMFEAVLGEALESGLVRDGLLPKSEAEVEAIWRPREDITWVTRRHGDWCVGDISLSLRYMDRYVRDLDAAMRARWPESELYVFGHVADGNLHIFAAPGGRDPAKMSDCYRLMHEPLPALGGSMAAEHGIARQKVEFLHYSRTPAELELMGTLKRTLDPKGILNPGRVIRRQPH